MRRSGTGKSIDTRCQVPPPGTRVRLPTLPCGCAASRADPNCIVPVSRESDRSLTVVPFDLNIRLR